MEKIYIICVEDQPEVLESIAKDLQTFEPLFRLEECSSAQEATELMEEIDMEGDYVGLIISDHVMPGETGVDFLIKIHRDPRFRNTRKLLLTGLATHQDTIKAINNADIDRFIEKPWDREVLVNFAKNLLTAFIMDQGIEYEPYLPLLDKQFLFSRIRKGGY